MKFQCHVSMKFPPRHLADPRRHFETLGGGARGLHRRLRGVPLRRSSKLRGVEDAGSSGGLPLSGLHPSKSLREVCLAGFPVNMYSTPKVMIPG